MTNRKTVYSEKNQSLLVEKSAHNKLLKELGKQKPQLEGLEIIRNNNAEVVDSIRRAALKLGIQNSDEE